MSLINSYRFKSEAGFVSTWNTENLSTGSSATKQVAIPTVSVGIYNCTVDWGDGNIESGFTTYNDARWTHTYAVAGNYSIEITGQLEGWQFNNSGDRLKMLDITNWGEVVFNQTASFYGCANLTLASVEGMPTITNTANNFFRGCTSITTINNVNDWEMVNVTDLTSMFLGVSSFNQSIDGWNVSNVTNLSNMFYQASSFNQSLTSWNVSNVTKMSYMFFQASSFNQSLNSWDVSNVTSMSNIFRSATVFNGNISGWITTSLTDISYAFASAPAFNQDISGWNVSLTTNMLWIFNGATAFNQDISSWDVSGITSFFEAFKNATAFNQDISSWVVSSATTMTGMFRGATSFNQNISGWNVSAVTSMSSMFNGTTSFDQNIGSWDITAVTDMQFMFWTVTLSTTNYDAILVGWEGQVAQNNVTFSGGNSTYTGAGGTARAALIADHAWAITDGGPL